MITIKEITEKKIWEAFLNQKEIFYYPFFQSWNWGNVQKSLGFTIYRFRILDNKKIVGVCQIVDVQARRGRYFHLRHGPVLLPFNQKVFDTFLNYIKKLAQKKKIAFIRMSPLVKKEDIDITMLREKNFRDAPVHNMDAEICWVLDITKTEEELLKDMRKTHRYLVKKALGMDITLLKDKKIPESFVEFYKNLSQRKHFVPHKGINEELEIFGKQNQEVLFLAKYNNKIISGAMIAFVGSMAIYRHSASDNDYRDIPAMYLIQWEAIKEAKKQGMKLYNFWGVAPEDAKNHPWKGLTLFKTGFGGEKLEFLHAQDLPLSPMYWKTYLIEKYSTWKKGY